MIAAERDCLWSASADAAWISISSPSGQGEAVVGVNVAVNPAPAPRTATIAVGSQSVTIAQQAAPCVFKLSRTSDSIGASGGRLSVSLTTLAGCSWRAATDTAWIQIASGSSGDASGTVELTIGANAGPRRVGIVNAGGQDYTVDQAAAPAPAPAPTPTPTPTPAPTPEPAPAPSPAPAPAPAPEPAPAPTPAPTPAPAPEPTPAPTLTISGTVSAVTGKCPSIQFVASATSVTTDKKTAFEKGKCTDVKNGKRVDVTGTFDGSQLDADVVTLLQERR